ncbi:GtrA family protein [Niabella yanshanensis]|uniref:GtrA family protein n=1 Tax=Niabella yanshanensis TaxID=577386 RepID=A0ABZ0W6Y3_9BACT|nr:GtrA family protein [Niabella yanshanensis]WQD38294.1 GtrA family protein [Niabella yanshanensis]
MTIQTFRYLATGASNTLLGLITFYIAYHYIVGSQDVNLGFFVFESYTASLAISFTVALFWGFFLMKYVVFDDSKIKGRVQFFRYLLVCLLNLFLNWLLLKLAVEYLHIYPTFAQLGTTGILIIVSYLVQRNFTFKKTVVPDYVSEEEENTTTLL